MYEINLSRYINLAIGTGCLLVSALEFYITYKTLRNRPPMIADDQVMAPVMGVLNLGLGMWYTKEALFK